MKPVHPVALFRLSVLGQLVSRQNLARGELKAMVKELALKHYDIPGSRHTLLSEKTIEAWYYAWKKHGIDALVPKRRIDRGQSKTPEALQAALIEAKQDNLKRSINSLLKLVQLQQLQGAHALSRSSVYRLLLSRGLSRPMGASQPKELRRFEADYPGDIIYGDVMHGPKVVIQGKTQKSCLVSLMDDKSRLILYSAFCPSETALDIEYVLKQALLCRGLPKRLVIDNGAAYRAHSLQGICARLSIQLIYCRPYAPEGKGKLERWHRTLRDQFLIELRPQKIYTLDELNSLLWAWIDQLYHPAPHSALGGKAPLTVWREIKQHITQLVETKSILPIWFIDESHNLPVDFFKDFPSFLNFSFDSKDLMTVWFLGHSQLENTLNLQPYTALASRIQVKEKLEPVFEKQRFSSLIKQAFEEAGTTQQLLSDPGVELIRMASKGKPRIAGQIIQNALRLATEKKINHLPDDIVMEAIDIMK